MQGGLGTAGWTLSAACAVAAISDWIAVAAGARRPEDPLPRQVEYVLKPLALVLLIAAVSVSHPVITATHTVSSARQWLFVAALGFSLAGDILLMVPVDLFEGGLAAFLLAHAFYIAGLTRGGGSISTIALASGAIAVVATPIATTIMRRVLREHGHGLFAATSVYMTALVIMAGAACASGSAIAAAGGLVFLASDATLAWDRFVGHRKYARVAIMVTYHLAQGLLAGSLFVR